MSMNSYTLTTRALPLNLAVRCRAARRAYRRARAQGVVDPEVMAELDGRNREAWNAYQAAKQLVATHVAMNAQAPASNQVPIKQPVHV
jgi:hypothetical protein